MVGSILIGSLVIAGIGVVAWVIQDYELASFAEEDRSRGE